ncbi:MAG: putative tRNA-dihydrouridine synthase [Monoraphidium minutum]|nr:MAG: putative tRNA-dihydrouridine synthase [Monoraphidium minutum]
MLHEGSAMDPTPGCESLGGTQAPSPSALALIAKSVAPVKQQYLVFREAQPAGAPAADGGGGGALPAAGAPAATEAVTTGGAAVAKKSRGQQKRERNEQKTQRVCVNHLTGSCSFGGGCRFSHDIGSYLASKPRDLPGACPFAAGGFPCPYAVACRWATTHSDASGDAARAAAEQPQQQQGEQGDGGGGGGGDSGGGTAPPPGVSAELLAASASCAPLPALRSLERPLNTLSKEVQQALWKGRYDFGRADGVLAALGVTPGPGRGRGRGGGGGRGGGHEQGRGRQAQGGRGGQQQQPEAAAAGADAPEAKRAKVEGAPAEGAVGGGGGGGAVSLDDLYGLPAPAPAASEVAAAPGGGQQPGGGGGGAAENVGGGAAVSAAARQAEYVETRLPAREKPRLDLAGKTYLAPLTTVGNLPFRRLCKGLGCEVTCGEMALATNLLQGQSSEWALLKRHPCEDIFGVQVCGGYPDAMARLCQVVSDEAAVDFVDLNCGCPIDLICSRQARARASGGAGFEGGMAARTRCAGHQRGPAGAGSALLTKPRRFEEVVRAAVGALDVPLIVKMRKGYNDGADVAHDLIPQIASWGAAAVTLHGRTRQQRYSREADWEYIQRCAGVAAGTGLPLIGNGDVMSYEEWAAHLSTSGVTTCMLGRGPLIKPWVFTEITERRVWDISAGERLDLMKTFVSHGLEHWGADARGVEATRRFLLEWLSFAHRYVPVGLLEVAPQRMGWRPPSFAGRSDLETLLGSEAAGDWVRISEMLLGPAPPGFTFAPKHKSNAYLLSAVDAAQLARGAPPGGAGGGGGGGGGGGVGAGGGGDGEDEGEEENG